MTCVGCGWLGGASRKAAARAIRGLQGPCRRAWTVGAERDSDCFREPGLTVMRRVNRKGEAGGRSCWGSDLSRLTVEAPSPNLWFSSDLSYFLPSQVCTCSRAWNIFLLPLPGSLLALQVPALQLVLLECC